MGTISNNLMHIVEISDRGQITIPKKLRSLIKGQFLSITVDKNNIVLSPVQTVDQFFEELDASIEDYEKNGGVSLDEMIKKYG